MEHSSPVGSITKSIKVELYILITGSISFGCERKEANAWSCAVVDKELSSEGVPKMADGAINKDVDQDVNKFT